MDRRPHHQWLTATLVGVMLCGSSAAVDPLVPRSDPLLPKPTVPKTPPTTTPVTPPVVTPTQPPAPVKKVVLLPVPDAATQTAAIAALHDVFKDDYSKRRAADRLALAQTLLERGKQSAQPPAERFAALREVIELAGKIGEVDLALEAADELAKSFAVTAREETGRALTAVTPNLPDATAAQTAAFAILSLIDSCIAADDFALAVRLSKDCDTIARKLRDPSITTRAKFLSERCKELHEEFTKLGELTDLLGEMTPDGHYRLGRFLCLYKNDWLPGLLHLAAGDEKEWGDLARSDLAAHVSIDKALTPVALAVNGEDGKPLNLDLEKGSIDGWTATGDAWKGQPIAGDTVTPRKPPQASRHAGKFWIGGFEKLGDRGTGTLTSPAFTVNKPLASFLVGGGKSDQTRVELIDESGNVVFKAHGEDTEDMRRVTVDLGKHQGKKLRIRLVDEGTVGWGHVNFDDFVFHDSSDNSPAVAAADAWRTIATDLPRGTQRESGQLRALTWYRRALPQFTGTTKAKIEKRISELERALGPVAQGNLPLYPPGAALLLTFEADTLALAGTRLTGVLDASGSGMRFPASGVKPVRGPFGIALEFDGTGQIDIGNPKQVQIAGNQTIAFWMWTAALDERRNPYNKSYMAEGTMTLEPSGSVSYFYGAQSNGPYTNVSMNIVVTAKTWVHLALVRDFTSKTVTWYRNGKPINTVATAYATASVSNEPLIIGNGYTNPFIGKLDDVAVWPRALSAPEVLGLYSATATGRFEEKPPR